MSATLLCPSPGCWKTQAECTEHGKRIRRDHKTVDERKLYSSNRWTQASRRYRQHHPTCAECKRNGRTTPAQEVDHIIPARDGADFWNESNWQSLCRPCHLAKSRREQGIYSGSMRPVTVVVGLPGSGKSTYVQSKAKRGDLVVDVDYLFQALSGLQFRDNPECLLPFVASARDAIYERLRRPSEIGHAWIITTDRNAAYGLKNKLNAEVIELQVEESERLSRLKARLSA